MVLSPRKNGLDSLLKEVRVFKENAGTARVSECVVKRWRVGVCVPPLLSSQ